MRPSNQNCVRTRHVSISSENSQKIIKRNEFANKTQYEWVKNIKKNNLKIAIFLFHKFEKIELISGDQTTPNSRDRST